MQRTPFDRGRLRFLLSLLPLLCCLSFESSADLQWVADALLYAEEGVHSEGQAFGKLPSVVNIRGPSVRFFLCRNLEECGH